MPVGTRVFHSQFGVGKYIVIVLFIYMLVSYYFEYVIGMIWNIFEWVIFRKIDNSALGIMRNEIKLKKNKRSE